MLWDAISYNNIHGDPEERPRDMDLDVVRKDTARMSQTTIILENQVQSEVKLLVAIEQQQAAAPGIQKVIPYIGTSRLSCRGCDYFIRKFNIVHMTSWSTRGSHGKSYYPWILPSDTPKEGLVLSRTYGILAWAWARSYPGYRQRYAPLDPESTAQAEEDRCAFQ